MTPTSPCAHARALQRVLDAVTTAEPDRSLDRSPMTTPDRTSRQTRRALGVPSSGDDPVPGGTTGPSAPLCRQPYGVDA
ncbi:hypothetical protein SAMN05421756_106209 [Microlunatus flavus]|uniref:Uncharacterized protein n=1 Tax=Microlunatus flavus TaxID=1036181 RepID=A0A1H9JI44_9ACTN|nr:hypothetical protein SAMN05421756_106209 [Microlunatus flavus]